MLQWIEAGAREFGTGHLIESKFLILLGLGCGLYAQISKSVADTYLVARLNIMEPFPDHTFRPGETLTRGNYAMIVQEILMVVSGDGALRTRFVGAQSPFPDIRNDHFAFNAAIIATTRGILEADRKSGAFRVTDPVSGPDALLSLRKLAEIF